MIDQAQNPGKDKKNSGLLDSIQRYITLRQRIDEESERLTALHGDAIACRPGCTSCCRNLTVFPIEFHAIKHAMRQAGINPNTIPFDTSAPCGFLNEGLCRIYPYRPIICRTHGLPILFLDDSSNEYTWEVSFCELNFTERDCIEFNDDTLINIEDINTELCRINHDFLTLRHQKKGPCPARIPLAALCKTLKNN